ncbi:MAG TPA: endolytic transglycosylase MltG [Acidimicrobiales bacterium]|jgi:UPF0755 protein|nr:endolytic transglycosylase MltG [Acidimicrobiales bacterium]
MAALLGGAILVAPMLLLNRTTVGSPLAAGQPASRHGGAIALTSNLAPVVPPPTTTVAPGTSTVTVEPGMTVRDVSKEVGSLPGHNAASFARTAASGAIHSFYTPIGSDDLEGVLGTGTYDVMPGESDEAILRAMVVQFSAQAQEAGLTFASAAGRGLSVYEILTAASIVQQEGYIAKNMPGVARVIYNRLSIGKPLQMNATVLYPLGQVGGAFTVQDEHVESPYNSYLHTGLPPTPICTPSLTALRAAMNPPVGSWLYFNVVNADGTEAFSSTFTGQLANEKLAQKLGIG